MTTDILLERNTDASADCMPNPPARKAFLDNRDDDGVGHDTRRVSRHELIAAGHKPMSPLKALRLRCLDCCAGSAREVQLCPIVTCPAWPFRRGTNPWRKEATAAQSEQGYRLARKGTVSTPNAFPEKENLAESASPGTHLPAAKLSTGKSLVFGSTAMVTIETGTSR